MAIDFTAANMHIDTGDWNVSNHDEMSITAWCTPTAFGTDPRVIEKALNDSGDLVWLLGITAGSPNKARCRVYTTVGYATAEGGAMVADTEYFLAGRYDGVNLSVYLDAVQVGSVPKAGNVRQVSADVWIADTPPDDTRPFFGPIEDVRVYDRCISLDELQTIYALRGRDNITRDLIGRWMLNEKAPGTTASGANSIIDLSGQEHHGTPVNSPPYEVSTLEWRRKVG